MLAPGKLAEVIVVDMRSPHLTPRQRTVSALTYSARGSDVAYSSIGGEVVRENGRCTMVDEEEVIREAQDRAEDLIEPGLVKQTPAGGPPHRRTSDDCLAASR